MSEDRVQRVAQAISAQMGGTTFERLAEAMLEAVPEVGEVDRLNSRLHELSAHPDFEYKITETGRKTDEEGRPEGLGWERNTALGAGRGWDRDDYTETNYWRRLMSHRQAEQAATIRAAEERKDRIAAARDMLRTLADQAQSNMFTNSTYWGRDGEGNEAFRWRRGVDNALGSMELPCALSPEVVLALADWIDSVLADLERDLLRWEMAIFTRADEFAKRLLRWKAPVER